MKGFNPHAFHVWQSASSVRSSADCTHPNTDHERRSHRRWSAQASHSPAVEREVQWARALAGKLLLASLTNDPRVKFSLTAPRERAEKITHPIARGRESFVLMNRSQENSTDQVSPRLSREDAPRVQQWSQRTVHPAHLNGSTRVVRTGAREPG